jgi:hypothetical protein
MAVGLDVFADLAAEKESDHPPAASSERPVSGVPASSPESNISAITSFSQEVLAATGAGPEVQLQVISAWARLHGFVRLEIGSNFSSMGVDADALVPS